MKIRTHQDDTGLAAEGEVWTAIDEDTYDGAPDSATLEFIQGSNG